ncbi:aromatic-ring-hydroxylating dioxygenase subunit beta [Streptomyces sp. Y7]|uniref:aromatic-ring-hydroxylating dioxygenase subunit beta n=1 Tax=Streptomyces sp. Y7 TaxID=3342392 RepID=UPI003713F421
MATLTRAEAEDFLFYEARLLDEERLKDWLSLMTSDVVYWVPNNADEVDPSSHISIIYDNYLRLENRVWRITESGLNHTQDPPSKFIRFISNISTEPAERDDEATVRCNVLLTEYRPGVARDAARDPSWRAARCDYRLRSVDGTWKIAQRKVMLLDNDGPLPAMTYVF